MNCNGNECLESSESWDCAVSHEHVNYVTPQEIWPRWIDVNSHALSWIGPALGGLGGFLERLKMDLTASTTQPFIYLTIERHFGHWREHELHDGNRKILIRLSRVTHRQLDRYHVYLLYKWMVRMVSLFEITEDTKAWYDIHRGIIIWYEKYLKKMCKLQECSCPATSLRCIWTSQQNKCHAIMSNVEQKGFIHQGAANQTAAISYLSHLRERWGCSP